MFFVIIRPRPSLAVLSDNAFGLFGVFYVFQPCAVITQLVSIYNTWRPRNVLHSKVNFWYCSEHRQAVCYAAFVSKSII